MTDEQQIRRLHAIYAQRTDDGDALGKSELFAEDGRYFPTTGEFVGRAAIYQELVERAKTRPPDRRSKHLCGNSVITVHGDEAEAATDFVVYQRMGDEPWQILVVGRYYDRFVRRGGTWLFSENRPVSI
jgi:3-phenylpropionate/cinnamic acid dioxygenase small subunit